MAHAVDQYVQNADAAEPVVFDRGIPDLMAYAHDFGLDDRSIRAVCKRHPYNRTVLIAPAWAEIYTQDDERTMTFEAANAFGDALRRAYQDCGYSLIDLPKTSVENRAEFVLTALRQT